MPDPGHGQVVVLREIRCRGPGCQATFFICSHCYRGQCYCGAPCRARARVLQHRVANARYQRSQAGRLDHLDREREFRQRCRATARVTDQSSLTPDSASLCGHETCSPLPPPAAAAPRAPCSADRPVRPPWRCSVCGRHGFPAGWLLLWGGSRLCAFWFWKGHLP